MIERGDIRWFRFERPDERRPVLVLGRRAAVPALSQIVVVPSLRPSAGVAGEVVLDEGDGLAVRSTIKVEWIRAVDRTAIGPRIAALPVGRWLRIGGEFSLAVPPTAHGPPPGGPAPAAGLEPATRRLTAACSTN